VTCRTQVKEETPPGSTTCFVSLLFLTRASEAAFAASSDNGSTLGPRWCTGCDVVSGAMINIAHLDGPICARQPKLFHVKKRRTGVNFHPNVVDLRGAQAALDNLSLRAPIAGTVLQLAARSGELASPSAPLPLVLLGDLSVLRVRVELDERDVGEIRLGQPVVVRSAAFPGRDFAGKVLSVAPSLAPVALAREDRVVSRTSTSRK